MNVKGLPLGMSMNEFLVRKRKLRRRAWVEFFIFFIMFGFGMELFGWLGGWYDSIPSRQLEDLRVAYGIFDVKEGKERIPIPRVALKDETTGGVILTMQPGLCGGGDLLKKYSGHFAKVLYADGPGKDIHWLYQLEIDGQIVCDFNSANRKAEERNRKEYRQWVRICWPIGIGIISLLVSFGQYKRNISRLSGEDNRT